MEYWSIILNNYKGYTGETVYYFDNYSVARETFEKLCEKYKDYELRRFDDRCCWLDLRYNYASSFAKLKKSTIQIFDKVVDL